MIRLEDAYRTPSPVQLVSGGQTINSAACL